MTSLLAARKAAFIFNYLRDGHCEITLSWDDGADFVEAFLQAFPDRSGRKDDPALERASKRLYRACKELAEDGWLARWVLPNQELADPWREPRWQHVYDLGHGAKRRLRDYGETPFTLAAAWSGIPAERIEEASLLADANSWYSGPQLETIAGR